jgi:hypothetical protein
MKIGTLRHDNDQSFLVETANEGIFSLDLRVNGRIRPFSIVAYQEQNENRLKTKSVVLRILNNLFFHKGQMYLIRNIREGTFLGNYVFGPRLICKLVNFPFKRQEEIDSETWERLGRYRGIRVGEISGLRSRGHNVTLEAELEDIGIPLSGATYLIYSSN